MSFLRRLTLLLSPHSPALGSRDPFTDTTQKSPKLLATPSSISLSRFSLPSASSSSDSSRSSSTTSASLFWRGDEHISDDLAAKWWRGSTNRFRSKVSKRQFVVIMCLLLAILFWIVPPPLQLRGGRKGKIVEITLSGDVEEGVRNPYQVLQTHDNRAQTGISDPKTQNTGASVSKIKDPVKWLQRNSNNKWAENTAAGGWGAGLGRKLLGGSFMAHPPGHPGGKPKAALISLVRNNELEGIVQSMRQLEWRWNRKYNYPWVFFNDEEFSEEFKVCLLSRHPTDRHHPHALRRLPLSGHLHHPLAKLSRCSGQRPPLAKGSSDLC